jgi:hypothetical protein
MGTLPSDGLGFAAPPAGRCADSTHGSRLLRNRFAVRGRLGPIGDHLVWELEGGEECMVWLEAEARRLAGAKD